jgi:hypothetical protein
MSGRYLGAVSLALLVACQGGEPEVKTTAVTKQEADRSFCPTFTENLVDAINPPPLPYDAAAVRQLDALHEELQGDADLYDQAGEGEMASNIRALATAIEHLREAVDQRGKVTRQRLLAGQRDVLRAAREIDQAVSPIVDSGLRC